MSSNANKKPMRRKVPSENYRCLQAARLFGYVAKKTHSINEIRFARCVGADDETTFRKDRYILSHKQIISTKIFKLF